MPTPRSLALLVAALLAACGGSASQTATPATTPAQTAEADRALPPTTAPAPPTFRLPITAAPVEYAATLALDPSKTEFRGDVTIAVDFKAPTTVLWLNGHGLTVDSASVDVDGRTLEAGSIALDSDQFVGLSFPESVGPGTVTVRIAYTGKLSDTELSGIFRQKEGDHHYLFTQFEAIDARRAFPSFDEPQHKTPWQLSIRVPEGQRAFANTPEVNAVKGDDGWTTYEFAKSKPIPSYLVAFAVGPFEVVDAGTAGRNDTPLRIIVPQGRADEAAYAAKHTGKVLELLEDYFDQPYPYEKLDSIAVPSFFGAMENPGLVTYAMRILLTAPGEETPRTRQAYIGIAAHELAHQWFGNLVTMKWWDDLWLNESFATWMAAKITDQFNPEWNIALSAVAGSRGRESAFRADSLPAAKPVRQPVQDRGDIMGNSSAIMYAKGASVLGAYERWIGEEAFREGLRAYMKKHAWGNASAEDFFAALSAVSTPELAGSFATFIDQPGYPLVEVALRCEADKPPTLSLSQTRYLPAAAEAQADQLWQIPVCARYPVDGRGKQASRACTLMKEQTAELALTDAKRCPTWLVANEAAAGYYRVAYDTELLESNLVGAGVGAITLPERLSLIVDTAALVDAGKLSPAQVLTMVPKVLADRNAHVVSATVSIVKGVDMHLVPDARRPNYQRFIRKMYGKQARKLGFTPSPGDDADVRALRAQLIRLVAIQGDDKKLARQARSIAERWMKDHSAVAPEVAELALSVATHHGDRALYDRLLAAAKAAEDTDLRNRLIGALGGFTQPELARANLELVLGDTFEFREAAPLMRAALTQPELRESSYAFFKENIDAILAKLPSFYGRFVVYSAAGFCDEEHAQDAEAFFAPRVEKMMGGKDALAQVVEAIRLCAVQREAQLPSVAGFLERY